MSSDPRDITYILWLESYANTLENRIEELESGRPQGRWIVSDRDSTCSVCGKDETEFIHGSEDWYGYGFSKYCPNCGAKMNRELRCVILNCKEDNHGQSNS